MTSEMTGGKHSGHSGSEPAQGTVGFPSTASRAGQGVCGAHLHGGERPALLRSPPSSLSFLGRQAHSSNSTP